MSVRPSDSEQSVSLQLVSATSEGLSASAKSAETILSALSLLSVDSSSVEVEWWLESLVKSERDGLKVRIALLLKEHMEVLSIVETTLDYRSNETLYPNKEHRY